MPHKTLLVVRLSRPAGSHLLTCPPIYVAIIVGESGLQSAIAGRAPFRRHRIPPLRVLAQSVEP